MKEYEEEFEDIIIDGVEHCKYYVDRESRLDYCSVDDLSYEFTKTLNRRIISFPAPISEIQGIKKVLQKCIWSFESELRYLMKSVTSLRSLKYALEEVKRRLLTYDISRYIDEVEQGE